jgi:NitT/TauT family transport system ATP-binding protein
VLTTGRQIIVENLSVRRGSRTIFDRVSFVIQSGEFVTVVGTSGAGKSTLLHALAGFIPYTGSVEVIGRVGVVLQDVSTFPWLTVSGNISFGLEQLGRSERQVRVREMLHRVGLEGFEDRYPVQLSGGELQRLAVARALVAEPDVLLLDEPFSALDGPRRSSMQNWLLEMWESQARTVIFVTHDLEEGLLLGDRVLVVRPHEPLVVAPIPFVRPRSHEIIYSNKFNELKASVQALLA